MSRGLPSGFQAAARRKRSLAVGLSALALIFLTYLALYTVRGQNMDNLSMEALIAAAGKLHVQLSSLRRLVSVSALAVISVGVVIVALIRRRAALALRALLVVGGANLTAQALKALLTRPDLGVSLYLDNSYPSGHVTYAAAIAAALIMVSPHRARSALTALGWAWTALMSLMVISQGWHRLSDVLAALLLVAFWGFLAAPGEIRTLPPSGWAGVGRALTWTAFAVGVGLFAVAAAMYAPQLSEPLSLPEIYDLTAFGTRAGTVLAAATVLLSTGLAGVILGGLDRLGQGR